MFFPIDSLKRGGRFYLCWVADSWPLRFATITHRQLWSTDIRRLCDDLMEVIQNESGRPSNRFSLRLSSQLMRGLVRLYQKKVNMLLINVCMIQGHVGKASNRKSRVRENVAMLNREASGREQPALELPQLVAAEAPEDEARIAELIQNSGNVVANVQDITLREQVIPQFQLPPNDGFGEENPEQTLQALERTMEMMMAPTDVTAQHSGIDVADITDKSHDRTRSAHRDARMERISDYDGTFRKSDGEDLRRITDFEKEIPEIPDVSIPEMPVLPEKQPEVEVLQEVPVEQPIVDIPQEIPIEQPIPQEPIPPVGEAPLRTTHESQQIELEELEETEPRLKRRRFHRKLIIDKHIKISSRVLSARIEQSDVELRCKDSSEDIIEIREPVESLMRRAASAGGPRPHMALALARMYQRNLGVVGTLADDRQEEGVMRRQQRSRTRSIPLERIEGGRDQTVRPDALPPQPEPAPETTEQASDTTGQALETTGQAPEATGQAPEATGQAPEATGQAPEATGQALETTEQELPLEETLFRDVTNIPVLRDLDLNVEEQDISEALTQKLEELGPRTRKRATKSGFEPSPKKKCGYQNSNRSIIAEQENRPRVREAKPASDQVVKDSLPTDEKEVSPINEAERRLPAMLQAAGLAEIQQPMEIDSVTGFPPVSASLPGASRRNGSERSETPLGSLDRTKVSLGDSERTTDSRRFIREEWGNEGTMLKIVKLIKQGEPVTVERLVADGPVIRGRKAIIAATCFSSILKLKFHGFIKVVKRHGTLEIEDIKLGFRFY